MTRVGLDLVEIDEVAAAIEHHGERYLRRVYTESEMRRCHGRPASLAACFAAKEALFKALDLGQAPLPLTSIELELDAGRRAGLKLHSAAGEITSILGVQALQVSIGRTGRLVAAIVVAS